MKPKNHLRVNARKVVVLSLLSQFDGKTARQIYELMLKKYPDTPLINFLTFYRYLQKWKHYKKNSLIDGKKFRKKIRWHLTDYGKTLLEDLLFLQSRGLPLKLKYPVRVIEHSSGKTKWIYKPIIRRDEQNHRQFDAKLIDKSNEYLKRLIIDKKAREERERRTKEEIETRARLEAEARQRKAEEQDRIWKEEERKAEEEDQKRVNYLAEQERYLREYGKYKDEEMEEARQKRIRERRRRFIEEPEWWY